MHTHVLTAAHAHKQVRSYATYLEEKMQCVKKTRFEYDR